MEKSRLVLPPGGELGIIQIKGSPFYLDTAKNTAFLWSLYIESEGYGDPSVETIRTDLTYIRDHYAISPEYLKIRWQICRFRLWQ